MELRPLKCCIGPKMTPELKNFERRNACFVHLVTMTSLSDDNQADITETFNSTSRYLDDLLNIDNPYFEGMVNQIYPPELQLNKANTSDTEAPLLDLHLSISYGFVSCKIYDKCDDFDFDIVNFPFFGWRCSTSSLLWSDYFSTY